MNDTKWKELRRGILESGARPSFRAENPGSDAIGSWDSEWHHHFCLSGYDATEWCEIRPDSDDEKRVVEEVLRKYQIPIELHDGIYRIYGYVNDTARIVVLK